MNEAHLWTYISCFRRYILIYVRLEPTGRLPRAKSNVVFSSCPHVSMTSNPAWATMDSSDPSEMTVFYQFSFLKQLPTQASLPSIAQIKRIAHVPIMFTHGDLHPSNIIMGRTHRLCRSSTGTRQGGIRHAGSTARRGGGRVSGLNGRSNIYLPMFINRWKDTVYDSWDYFVLARGA